MDTNALSVAYFQHCRSNRHPTTMSNTHSVVTPEAGGEPAAKRICLSAVPSDPSSGPPSDPPSAPPTLESMLHAVIGMICQLVPLAERRATVAALAQCSKALNAAAVGAVAAVATDATRIEWGAQKPELVIAGTSPVRAGAFKGAEIYAFAGYTWVGSAQVLAAQVRALEEDALVLFAWNVETRRLMVTISRDARHIDAVEEFEFYRLGPWQIQAWRHKELPHSRGARVHVGEFKETKAALRRRFEPFYTAAVMTKPIAEMSMAFPAFEGLLVRFPRAIMDWDGVSMMVASCASTKHREASEQNKCLHYTTIYGDALEAGLATGIGMDVKQALSDWLVRTVDGRPSIF